MHVHHVYAFMYVCMCVCMYVCMYVCMNVHACVCIYIMCISVYSLVTRPLYPTIYMHMRAPVLDMHMHMHMRVYR